MSARSGEDYNPITGLVKGISSLFNSNTAEKTCLDQISQLAAQYLAASKDEGRLPSIANVDAAFNALWALELESLTLLQPAQYGMILHAFASLHTDNLSNSSDRGWMLFGLVLSDDNQAIKSLKDQVVKLTRAFPTNSALEQDIQNSESEISTLIDYQRSHSYESETTNTRRKITAIHNGDSLDSSTGGLNFNCGPVRGMFN